MSSLRVSWGKTEVLQSRQGMLPATNTSRTTEGIFGQLLFHIHTSIHACTHRYMRKHAHTQQESINIRMPQTSIKALAYLVGLSPSIRAVLILVCVYKYYHIRQCVYVYSMVRVITQRCICVHIYIYTCIHNIHVYIHMYAQTQVVLKTLLYGFSS